MTIYPRSVLSKCKKTACDSFPRIKIRGRYQLSNLTCPISASKWSISNGSRPPASSLKTWKKSMGSMSRSKSLTASWLRKRTLTCRHLSNRMSQISLVTKLYLRRLRRNGQLSIQWMRLRSHSLVETWKIEKFQSATTTLLMSRGARRTRPRSVVGANNGLANKANVMDKKVNFDYKNIIYQSTI